MGYVKPLAPGQVWDEDARQTRAATYRGHAQAQGSTPGPAVSVDGSAAESQPKPKSRWFCGDCLCRLPKRPRLKASGRCQACQATVGKQRCHSQPRKREGFREIKKLTQEWQ